MRSATTGTEAPRRTFGPGPWQVAEVVEVRPETASARTIGLRLERPSPHLAGQHYLVRLTAPDGYRATRSYSVATPPDGGDRIDLTVERLEDGEVSAFLCDELRAGDRLEVRGPIGGWFAWSGDEEALLLGGGSGVVPLMAMLRLSRRAGTAPAHLVVSVRGPEELYYGEEMAGSDVTVVYSRRTPPGWARPAGRLRAGDLPPWAASGPLTFVCGSPAFAEHATGVALSAGVPADRIRVERFGPTG